MRKHLLAILVSLSAMFAVGFASERDYTSYVDTRIGTDSNFSFSHGNTYPATGMPFAQHLWSPQTGERYDGWKYSWSHDSIRGFGQTHQCSPWVQDYGVFMLMPQTGELVTGLKERGARFRHEKRRPGRTSTKSLLIMV